MASETVPASQGTESTLLAALAEIAHLADNCDNLLTADTTTAREEAALLFVRQIGALADAARLIASAGPARRGDFVDWMAPYLKEARHAQG